MSSHSRQSKVYLPFERGQYRLNMGLLPLPLDQWIEFGDDAPSQFKEKHSLFAGRHDDVFQALPQAAEPSAQVLEILRNHLPQYHPSIYERDGPALRNLVTKERWDFASSDIHSLEQAARLVQEDLCILQFDGSAYRLTAASLCFPANWDLKTKLGQTIDLVHEPVPGYQAALSMAVNRFFDALSVGRLVSRANWFILDNPALFQLARVPMTAAVTSDNAGQLLWWRVERQTLQKLPGTGAVLFTIRTHVTRLEEAIIERQTALALAAMLRTMPVDTQRYRNMADVLPALLTWLSGRGG